MDYNEKLKLAKEALDSGSYDKETIEHIFPELKDEIIRKELIELLKHDAHGYCEQTRNRWFAWLEKQGEKKPDDKVESKSDWSEEDIRNLQDIDSILFYDRRLTEDVRTRLRNCIKSLKDRVLPQPKSAWSEEDKLKMDTLIHVITNQRGSAIFEGFLPEELVNWLKSLKERYTWKPSDEQIEALLKLEEMHVLEHEKTPVNAYLYMVVKSIREQLLKLREEQL
jgi:hypothetical protein